MKLSISNIAWNDTQDEAVYNLMKQYGYEGLEIAPTRIIKDKPYDNIDGGMAWFNQVNSQYGLVVSSMQSIWYGRTENIFSSIEERQILLEYTKKAIDFAAAIKCGNLVFGCPRNRVIETNSQYSIAVEFFSEIGDYAKKKKTCIGMEANPPIYNTNFINTTSEAIDLIKNVGSDGFRLNLDLGTVIVNEENIDVLADNYSLINHVHISEPGLLMIKRRELFSDVLMQLKKHDYKGFVSIEMGRRDNISEIENTMKYVASIN